ncbi:unnamed protein product [Triticum turgidum subsp. durum]|uniref:Glycosyltransferase n=1 Tax=Triticum turgidum subsp. durum TaxID=4567 RepID=A0A9R0ZS61_TRITD|nr:unnamed protein product [Triticum turgidum subsp. durum]
MYFAAGGYISVSTFSVGYVPVDQTLNENGSRIKAWLPGVDWNPSPNTVRAFVILPSRHLARLLYACGAHVTFVHTQFNYRRLVGAKGEAAVRPPSATAARFRVEVIEDGMSLSMPQHDVAALADAVGHNCPGPFRDLLRKLADEERAGAPPVTCVVADTAMAFAATAAREAGMADAVFFTASACGLLGYSQFHELFRRGLLPLKDGSCLTNGYLDTPLDWVPGMKNMRLRDMPTFCHTTDADDTLVNEIIGQMKSAVGSKAIILNTFYELESDVVDALAAIFPPVYTVGPLAQVIASSGAANDGLDAMDISIWQEDPRCLTWLDGKPDKSVVYVNFGSVAVMTAEQTREFALGLATCGYPFLWVKRPDMVNGDEVALPEAFRDELQRGGGLVVPWCPQPAVLKHAAVGLFVTHCGWNSLLEAVVAGLPVLAWPVFAEQTTNCRQVLECWRNGMALPGKVESGAVSGLVREMMSGELGKEKRAKAAEWRAAAEAAAVEGGSSLRSVARLVNDVLLLGNKTFETAHEAARAYDASTGHLAPPLRLVTDEDRRIQHRRERRLLIAEADEYAMAEWRQHFPEDVAAENDFWV